MGYIVVTIQERDKWMSYVKKALIYDFYHSWQYHSKIKVGEAFLFVYEEGDNSVIIPFVKRAIVDSDFFDLTSAYGYVGPIANVPIPEMGKAFLVRFKQAFLRYLKQEKIVCVFSRLHPIIEQSRLLENIGGLYENGATVYIDLFATAEDQKSHYRKSVKNSINALIAKNPEVREVKSDDDIKTFAMIYAENMRRLNANEYYNFDEEYFRDLIGAEEFCSKPLILCLNNEAIAAGFFVYTNDIIEVHLLATKTNYLHLSPTKLLIHEASVMGKSLGMKYLHLGGGVGGREDSLFFWKSGFSDKSFKFQTWRYISNRKAYDQLAQQANGKNYQKDFFPSYRSLENS